MTSSGDRHVPRAEFVAALEEEVRRAYRTSPSAASRWRAYSRTTNGPTCAVCFSTSSTVAIASINAVARPFSERVNGF